MNCVLKYIDTATAPYSIVAALSAAAFSGVPSSGSVHTMSRTRTTGGSCGLSRVQSDVFAMTPKRSFDSATGPAQRSRYASAIEWSPPVSPFSPVHPCRLTRLRSERS